MSKYLIKLLLFLTVLLFFLNLNSKRFKYYLGNFTFEQKLQRFSKLNSKEKFNSVFFGSSHIFHQVDVSLFDKLNKKKGIETNSYNFGINACKTIESYHLLSNFLESNAEKKIKYVFIELQKNYGAKSVNTLSKRQHYFYTLNYLLKFSYLFEYNMEKFRKNILLFYAFFLNKINYRSTFYFVKEKDSYKLKGKNGYNFLKINSNSEALKKARNKFLSKKEDIININKKLINKNFTNKALSKFKKFAKILHSLEKKHNVEIYFVQHPFYTNLNEQKIEEINLLKIKSQNLNQIVSNQMYYFDSYHLNQKGALLFTKLISEDFTENY